jgi:hypothetical protein
MTRLIQIQKDRFRRVALVEEPHLRVLANGSSIYELAMDAIERGITLSEAANERVSLELLDYDPIYDGKSDWHVLPSIDRPEQPGRCLVSGTGLTHLGSARDRQAMHEPVPGSERLEELTDSMKMFRWGLDGGRPASGKIGTAPEWFYKGTGVVLRAHLEPLEVPSYAEDGGEEAEVAGVYIIASDGQPRRLGMTVGNEFSDHVFEKRNYLNLAGSKLRNCAIGPELVVEPEFSSVPGQVSIDRAGEILWSRLIRTGEVEMCHSLQNLEHHHFKFEQHRLPGDVHVHFFGADCLSFGEGIRLADEDVMQISFDGFGRALRNSVRVDKTAELLITAAPLR